jgi:hypothetical protein
MSRVKMFYLNLEEAQTFLNLLVQGLGVYNLKDVPGKQSVGSDIY